MAYDENPGAKKKKITMIALSSILLVAMVGAVTFGVTRKNGSSHDAGNGGGDAQVSTSGKAVKAICQPTDYKEACEGSLSSTNSTDPKELIKVAFKAAVSKIGDAIKNSTLLKDAAKDPRTSQALDTCKGLLNTSIDDLQRSFDKIGSFDVSKVDEYIADLKTWLSGSITYQQTCLDGFENTTGDTGEKMKKLLESAGELTSNGLAMVSGFMQVLEQLQIPGMSRRLLQDGNDFGDGRRFLDSNGFPAYLDPRSRRHLLGDNTTLKPNAVVAQDGSGQFKSITDAIKSVPPKNNQTFIILVKAGIYKEYVDIPRKMNGIVLIGEGPNTTKITGNKNYIDGTGTYQTATVAINGDNFVAKDIGFENSAGAIKHQAVALRVSGDYAIFYNCKIDGYQDTLYAHSYRQFYRDCNITGTVDFIFGDASAVFQNCKFIVRKPLENQGCMVTAQGRKERHGVGAIVIQGSQILAEQDFLDAKPPFKAFLGRPWKEFSRTIIMNSFIDGFIAPEGWSPWTGNFALNTLYFAEYQNKGPGSDTSRRVKWKGIQKITPDIADSFTPGKYIQGDTWIRTASVPYVSGVMSSS